jgi:hypothetical protein
LKIVAACEVIAWGGSHRTRSFLEESSDGRPLPAAGRGPGGPSHHCSGRRAVRGV